MNFSSLYMLYFNNDITKLPTSELQKKLSFCGLNEAEVQEVSNQLSKNSKFQYYIERPSIGKYVAIALSVLFVLWLWKKLTSRKDIDLFPSISVVIWSCISFSIHLKRISKPVLAM